MRRNAFLLSSCLCVLLLAPLALASSSPLYVPVPPALHSPLAVRAREGAAWGTDQPCTPLGWEVEMVDGARGAGFSSTSLALGLDGRPRIAYYDDSTRHGEYAAYDGSAWHIQTFDNGTFAGSYCSLALDSLDRPHIAYYGGSGNLKYAVYDGSAWLIEEVDRGNEPVFPSLALDAAGTAHVAYFDWANYDLRYARRAATAAAGAWDVRVVDGAGNVGFTPALALDPAGYPHISYNGGHDLRYAAFDGTAWLTETVDRGGGSSLGYYTSLALDGADRPHIGYRDETSGDLRYAHFSDSGWVTETVDTVGRLGEYTSLALDPAGRPHISYYDRTNSALKYACFDGNVWKVTTVASPGGMFTSLRLDAAGKPHISFYNGHLMYARGIDVWADFAWGPPTPTARLPVLFAATLTGTAPFSLTWDLGDGSFVAGPSALVHTYTAAGAYTVTLAATNGIGETYTARHRLAVLPGYAVYLGLVVR